MSHPPTPRALPRVSADKRVSLMVIFEERRMAQRRSISLNRSIAVPYCTLRLTVAVLLARFGSGVSDIAAAFSVITVPDASSHLHCQTHRPCGVRSHAAVFVADDLSCSLVGRSRACAQPRRAGDADVVEGRARRHLRVQHFQISVVGTEVPHREGIGEQVALVDGRR